MSLRYPYRTLCCEPRWLAWRTTMSLYDLGR